MRIDLASLGTFNRIGTAGATTAADSLATLADCRTYVETTRINFAPLDSVESLFDAEETAVSIAFEGALEGHALLVFDRASADYVLDRLAGPDADPAFLDEVANIMTSGFVDGWAEHLGEIIDISTPTPVDEPPRHVAADDLADFSFVFQSDIAIGPDFGCRFYLLPEPRTFLDVLQQADCEPSAGEVTAGELSTFIRLTATGAETVAETLETMTGIGSEVAVSHLDFVPIEDAPALLGDEEYVGTVFGFSGAMDGYLAVVFDAAGSADVADALVPPHLADDGMRKSAIEEIGNVTASGFVDGWANALDSTIDHTVPEFVDDMGGAILESIVGELARNQDFAYVFDVTVTAGEPLTCRLFAFPTADGFRTVVSGLDEDLDVSEVGRV